MQTGSLRIQRIFHEKKIDSKNPANEGELQCTMTITRRAGLGEGGLSDEAWDGGARGSPGLGGTPGPGDPWYEECIVACNLIE